MYQGSTTEGEGGGEAATEVVIGVAFEAEGGATARTGAAAVGEGVATDSWRIENIDPVAHQFCL